MEIHTKLCVVDLFESSGVGIAIAIFQLLFLIWFVVNDCILLVSKSARTNKYFQVIKKMNLILSAFGFLTCLWFLCNAFHILSATYSLLFLLGIVLCSIMQIVPAQRKDNLTIKNKSIFCLITSIIMCIISIFVCITTTIPRNSDIASILFFIGSIILSILLVFLLFLNILKMENGYNIKKSNYVFSILINLINVLSEMFFV